MRTITASPTATESANADAAVSLVSAQWSATVHWLSAWLCENSSKHTTQQAYCTVAQTGEARVLNAWSVARRPDVLLLRHAGFCPCNANAFKTFVDTSKQARVAAVLTSCVCILTEHHDHAEHVFVCQACKCMSYFFCGIEIELPTYSSSASNLRSEWHGQQSLLLRRAPMRACLHLYLQEDTLQV